MTTSDRHKNNELLFHQKIASQLFQVRALLNTPTTSSTQYNNTNHQRSPVYFADFAKHTIRDKFGLAEFLTNVAIAAQMNVLDVLGVDEDKFKLMHAIVNGAADTTLEDGDKRTEYDECNTLILRFAAEETCVKMELEEPVVEDSVEAASTPGKLTRRKSTDGLREGPFFGKKRVKEAKDTTWKVNVNYSIEVIATCSSRGLDASGRGKSGQKDPAPITLKSRNAEITLHTAADAPRPPLQAKVIRDPIDFDLTWLFQNISSQDFNCCFVVNQSHKSCRTPRRNKDIDAAVKYFSELEGWCHDICTYFLKGTCWNVDGHESRPNLDSIDADVVFVPVLPIFEPPSSALLRKNDKEHEYGEIKSLSPLLPIDDIRLFLNEQCRTLDEKIQDLVSSFPPSDATKNVGVNTSSAEAALFSLFSSNSASSSLITSAEATLFLLLSHSASITEYYIDSLQAIEQATVEVLNKACGREVTQIDFDNYVRYNYGKLFCNEMHAPKAFNVDIRRPNRVPDGIMRIEMKRKSTSNTSDETWPILTIAKEVQAAPSSDVHIKIPNIGSMTKISGKTYVHGWLTHQFAGQREFQYQLRTSARQFSSFILLTGTISHNQCMDVKNAMIVQNKEEVSVPLLLSRARAVGDFPGLVSSLSPQQQSFARSAREVQLESSIFAVCVVEIRPQLELLLGLPPNSLTKEVKLVKTLMSLFVDHQISSDLVSFDGPEDATLKEMIEEVKENVTRALEMANELPTEEMDEAQSAGASAEDIVEEPRIPFQRGALVKDGGKGSQHHTNTSDARCGDKISSSVSNDDNTSIADLFRKRRSNDTVDKTILMDELTPRTGGEQFIIDPFPKSMRRVPSLDYVESMGSKEATSSDITEMPRKLNAKLKGLQNKPLQQTAIETGDTWMQKNMLTPHSPAKEIGTAEQEVNTKRAMNLLDALSRSGSLPMQFSELHAIIGVTHCFQHTLMDTLVLENVDPIKQLSDSTLLLASVVHDTPVDGFGVKIP